MARLSLSLLGAFQATLDGERITGFESVKARALLTYLAVEADRPHRRESLAGLLWPDRPDKTARNNLRHALATLRHAIGDHDVTHAERGVPSFLSITRETIQFNRASDYWLDVEAFRASTETEPENRSAIRRLEEAIALYQGDFLEGFALKDSPAFDDWSLITRERLQRRASITLHRLVREYERHGEYGRSCEYAWRRVELEPWNEAAHQQLMRLLALGDQRTAALAQYKACRKTLQQELGIAPSETTIRLYERIRDHTLEPALSSALFPDTVVQAPVFQDREGVADANKPVFVARDRELAQLDRYLHLALDGHGRTVFVVGEAGQGKTALIGEFARKAQQVHSRLIVAGGNCNAYTGIGDPYLPFREILALLTGDVEARSAAGTIDSQHAHRLWHHLPLTVQTLVTDGPDLVDVFVPSAALVGRAIAYAPEEPDWLNRLKELVRRKAARSSASSLQQADLFEQYMTVLQALARRMPLVLILDNLQWADLGSISLLFHLGRRLEGCRILIVGAYRSEEVASGRSDERHPLEPVINELKREWGDIEIDLDRVAGQPFVKSLLDSEPNCLGAAFREMLYRQTGGHPLFTVELLRGMRERGDLVRDSKGRWIEGSTLDWETLPARVEAVIAERIGRLAKSLQSTLQVASIEGEIFTAEVVAQVQDIDVHEMVAHLSDELDRQHRLVCAQGITHKDGQRLSRYRFRHFLFQRYLYNGIDQIERAHLHESVGTALEALYGAQTKSMAVVPQLAWHFEKAGMPAKAITYLQRAGEKAVRLSANAESIAHLTKGLELLQMLPDTPERAGRELALQLALAVPLQALQGYSAPQVGDAYARARELCQQIGETPRLFPTLCLLNTYYGIRGEFQVAAELGEQMLDIAQGAEDPLLVAIAHVMMGWTLQRGEFAQSRAHYEHMVALYEPRQHRSLAYIYGADPGVYALAWMACTLWFLGYPDQAWQWGQKALVAAKELDHPFTLNFALSVAAAQLHIYRREFQTAKEWSEAEMRLADEERFPFYQATARVHLGCALAGLQRPVEGLTEIKQGLAILGAIGTKAYLTSFHAGLAEAYWMEGEAGEGLNVVEEAFTVLGEIDERYFEAELHRLKGELLLISGEGCEARAEACFWRAIEVARCQRAKSWELRATTSLCRLWRAQEKQHKTVEARQLLQTTYDWFTEGFGTPDLKEAEALLNALA